MTYKKIYLVGLIACTIALCSYQSDTKEATGVYWGAFDPPTVAHQEIISVAAKELRLKKLIVVVNNHKYKNYTYPLAERIEMVRKCIDQKKIDNVELLWQDENQKIDYAYLRAHTTGALCAIAGYDAYKTWMKYSSPEERNLYEHIAVIPRGNDVPVLEDPNALLLPIGEAYRHVSSTKVRQMQQ